MKTRIVLLLVTALALAACATAAVQDATNIAKVKVTADGQLILNGAETTLDALQQEFARLASVEGAEVWYYREAADSEPHPIAEEVIAAIIEAQLPVQFSETDFT